MMIHRSFLFSLLSVCCVYLLAPLSYKTWAQNPGSIDNSFNPFDRGWGYGDGFDSEILDMAILPSGDLFVNGLFTTSNTQQHSYISYTDSVAFTHRHNGFTGANSLVFSSIAQPDGKTIIVGYFTVVHGVPARYIARLMPDGSIDPSFNTGTGPNDIVTEVALQPDGKIVVAGEFVTINGVNRRRIARLLPNGSLDLTFNPGTGFDAIVYNLKIQPDGRIIAGGQFSTFNGTSKPRLLRMLSNGTLDASFNPNIQDGFVTDVHLLTNGNLLIGGTFSSISGSTHAGIARLMANGTIDNTFQSGTGFNGNVHSIITQPDGKVLVGGDFSNFNGFFAGKLVRLLPNGILDPTFLVGQGFSHRVNKLHLQADGKIIVAGGFQMYQQFTRNRLARLQSNGMLDTNFLSQSGVGGIVKVINSDANGGYWIGGGFTHYNQWIQGKIVQLHYNGLPNTNFSTAPFTSSVYQITPIANQKVQIGGAFTQIGSTSASRVGVLHPTGNVDLGFNTGFGLNAPVYCGIQTQDGGYILGGAFTTCNFQTRNRIVKLTPTGSIDGTFNMGTGFNSEVHDLAYQPDGKIIAVGGFTSYNGTPAQGIVRLLPNGDIDPQFNLPLLVNANIYEVEITAQGKILIAGAFTVFNSISVHYIVQLNQNGTLDNQFHTASGVNNAIQAMDLLPDGSIIIGGDFTSANGISYAHLAKLQSNGNLDLNFNIGQGFNANVDAVYTDANFRILVGGEFTAFDGIGKNRLCRVFGENPIQLHAVQPGYCVGDSLRIPIQIYGTLLAGNHYIIELSDAMGNFNQPIILDTLTGTNLSLLRTRIPISTLSGNQYRVRVRTSAPVWTSEYSSSFSVYPQYQHTEQRQICASQSYTLPSGLHVSLSGTYTSQLASIHGCDSIITTQLHVNPTYQIAQNVWSCPLMPIILPGGLMTNQAGTYQSVLTSSRGCDSVVQTTLYHYPTHFLQQQLRICSGDSASLPDGSKTSSAGIYDFQFISSTGCDSFIQVTVTINPTFQTHVNASVCAGEDFYLPNGNIVSVPGTYTVHLQSVSGCDSTLLYTVNHLPTYNLIQEAQICDGDTFYLPNGVAVSQSGDYETHLQTDQGCDSVITTQLQILSNPILPIVNGPTTVNQHSVQSYYVIPTIGYNYEWQVVGGAITSGWNTNQCTVQWSSEGTGMLILLVTGENGCTTELESPITITDENASIQNEESATIHIYPNPTHDWVHIEINNPNSQMHTWEIVDMHGKKMLEGNFEHTQATFTIHMQNWSAGMYLFKWGTHQTKRIIKY